MALMMMDGLITGLAQALGAVNDAGLRYNLPRDAVYEQLGYRTIGFRRGDRVYVTLPGGKREGFTCQPRRLQLSPLGIIGGMYLGCELGTY